MKLKDDNEFVEITPEEEIAANITRIRAFITDEHTPLSTSQRIMVGLALCRPGLLDEAQYPTRHIEQAWGRLDDAQRAAIIAWWK